MRKMLLPCSVAISTFCGALGAAQASAGPLPIKPSSASMFADSGAARQDARSALNTILNRFITEEEIAITTTSAADPETANGECPEESETKVADAEGAAEEKNEKQGLASPEPIYFAF